MKSVAAPIFTFLLILLADVVTAEMVVSGTSLCSGWMVQTVNPSALVLNTCRSRYRESSLQCAVFLVYSQISVQTLGVETAESSSSSQLSF